MSEGAAPPPWAKKQHPPWQRIAIVGCSGGGKSTLARAVAARTGLPAIHLDQAYWQPGWTMPPPGTWLVKHAALLAQPRWIIEGNYPSTLAQRAAAADLVIHVDLPRWRCLLRVLRRVITAYGSVRIDMAPGCPERFDAEFLRYVWTFKKHKMPSIDDAIKGQDILKFGSQREIDAWLDTLPPSQ